MGHDDEPRARQPGAEAPSQRLELPLEIGCHEDDRSRIGIDPAERVGRVGVDDNRQTARHE